MKVKIKTYITPLEKAEGDQIFVLLCFRLNNGALFNLDLTRRRKNLYPICSKSYLKYLAFNSFNFSQFKKGNEYTNNNLVVYYYWFHAVLIIDNVT